LDSVAQRAVVSAPVASLGGCLANIALALAATLMTLTAGEIALRFTRADPRIPLHQVCRCSYLYGLNPARPGISAQGLRDRVFAIPKPAGTSRVLVLGGSVTFGVGVPATHTFPKQLERLLQADGRSAEVINAGVMGYTPYNEWRWYLEKGRAFQPDVVVVAFCMNDVVDPELHWSGTRREIFDPPLEAIPNLAYHDHHVARLLGPRLPVVGRRSEVLRRVALLLDPRTQPEWQERAYSTIDGRRRPTYVTEEDDQSIRVLTDERSPEWRWLRSIYGRLRQAVESDGGRFVLLILPLAYQLDADYPLLPQAAFQRYCEQERIPCVDLLESFRRRRSAGLFPPAHGGFQDVWHLTPAGHRLAAADLRPVVSQGLGRH
jgi:GDSL-like Lipase/Acylhydrolase family